MLLKLFFSDLLGGQTRQTDQVEQLWSEIEAHYTNPLRYYHNLKHLQNLVDLLEPHQKAFDDWEMIRFAIFYHDLVYDVARNDNEEKSAVRAEQVLMELLVKPDRIQRCKNHILTTKGHSITLDGDTNWFTDADLGILGMDKNVYNTYCDQIRKEYAIYPDDIYNAGRSKVLEAFLKKPSIYKTNWFGERFEKNARLNMKTELDFLLSKRN